MNRFSQKVLILVTGATLSAIHPSGAATFNIADGDVAGLISAMNTADSNNQNNDINLAASGTYTLTAVNNSVNGDNGLPVIGFPNGQHNQLNIYGNGATITRGAGAPRFRIFFVLGRLALNQLIITNGDSKEDGGAILCGAISGGNGTLTASGCVFSGNHSDLSGGAISCTGASAFAVDSCTFINNTTAGLGGAIWSNTSLTVTDSTFTSNQAATAVAQAQPAGGAIYIDKNGSASLRYSTFSQNVATGQMAGDGGAVCAASLVYMDNCTLTGNDAYRGRAIFIAKNARLEMASCTLTQPIPQVGSREIFNYGEFIVWNSIVPSLQPNSGSTETSMGYNLSRFQFSSVNGPGDQTNTDPQLDPAGLQDNGGPTQTIALTYGSPAIDKGNRFGLTTDQRGFARPYDNPSIPNASGGDGSDIGAYEVQQGEDPVQGNNLVVTTTDDHDDGVCGGGDCSLREAIARSNKIPGPNTIIFAGGLVGTIVLQQTLGELTVSDDTIIVGPGARVLAISGNENHRVFNFSAGTSSISALTIRDGWNAGSGGGVTRMGGGIYNQATLTLNDCNLTNNFVEGGSNNDGQGGAGGSAFGGGIYNTGSLTLNRCTFGPNSSNGEANVAGGGRGSDASSINVSGGNGGDAAGGGVYNASGSTLTVNNCTFNSNGVGAGSGGNSTFRVGGSGGAGNGGAICNLGTMVLTGCTIDGNAATGGTGGTGSHGSNGANGKGIGGIASIAGSSSTAQNSITASNTGNNGGGNDLDGAFISSGYNLIGNGDFSTGFTVTGDQVGTTAAPIDPKLRSLQNNGGGTDTMAPLSNSPAIDQGKSFGLTTDQRSFGRTIDSSTPNASGGDGTDIGSYEVGGRLGPFTAVSRKFHGNNPTPFDVPLPLAGPIAVECRRNTGADTTGLNVGKDHEVVLTFAGVVTAVGSVAVTDSNNNTISSSFTRSNNVVTIDLHGVPNAPRRLTIKLNGVSDVSETVNIQVPMGVLAGDTTGDGTVNSSDVSQTKSKSGQTVGASNFRNDVTVDGTLNSSDVSSVKSKSGTALP